MDLSIVIPVLNEQEIIKELIQRVKDSARMITEDFEIILIDDGSQDNTWREIEQEFKNNSQIVAMKFTRNFGQHHAITAGLEKSQGDWVVVMDGDLQDEPENLPKLFNQAQLGFDVVFASRHDRTDSKIYLIGQRIFYFFLNLLSGLKFNHRNANFSIISKKVVKAFLNFPEKTRFYNSTLLWLGFESSNVEVVHGKRFKGTPSYTWKKRFKLAKDIVVAFSERPLKLAVYLGLLISLFSLVFFIGIFIRAIYWGYEVLGWASLITLQLFSTGIILIVIGIIGIYLSQVFLEVKNRPLYVVESEIYKS